MLEIEKEQYCEYCEKLTLHILKEDALEIDMECKQCHHTVTIIKTMF